MRLALHKQVNVKYAPTRRNSKDSSGFGRFKFIARYKEYTRAYNVSKQVRLHCVGRLQPDHVQQYAWCAGCTFVRPSRVRRFFIARIKRISAETKAIEAA